MISEKIYNDKYSKLNEIDKKIRKLETEIRNYFFDNVSDKDLNGELEVPLIANKNSDYERIQLEIKKIKMHKSTIEKKLANMQSFETNILNELKKEKLSSKDKKVELDRRLLEIKNDLENSNKILDEKLLLINDSPKSYLRFKDYESSNYSKIQSVEIRKMLKAKNKVLIALKNERKIIIESIKQEEEKENGSRKNLNLKKY